MAWRPQASPKTPNTTWPTTIPRFSEPFMTSLSTVGTFPSGKYRYPRTGTTRRNYLLASSTPARTSYGLQYLPRPIVRLRYPSAKNPTLVIARKRSFCPRGAMGTMCLSSLVQWYTDGSIRPPGSSKLEFEDQYALELLPALALITAGIIVIFPSIVLCPACQ